MAAAKNNLRVCYDHRYYNTKRYDTTICAIDSEIHNLFVISTTTGSNMSEDETISMNIILNLDYLFVFSSRKNERTSLERVYTILFNRNY